MRGVTFLRNKRAHLTDMKWECKHCNGRERKLRWYVFQHFSSSSRWLDLARCPRRCSFVWWFFRLLHVHAFASSTRHFNSFLFHSAPLSSLPPSLSPARSEPVIVLGLYYFCVDFLIFFVTLKNNIRLVFLASSGWALLAMWKRKKNK